MKQYLKYLNLLIIILFFSSAKSQVLTLINADVCGRVIEDSTEKEIAFVNIYNESRRQGFIADEKGGFLIPANPGDTLVFSALGYYPVVIFLNEAELGQERIIKLKPQIYAIGEVSVRAFRNYEEFKKQFLALDLSETDRVKLRKSLVTASREAAAEGEYERIVKQRLEGPGILIYAIPIASSNGQGSELSAEFRREKRLRVIDEKFNREIIYKLTFLTEDEITEFIGFCSFSEDFLYEASEYEILVKIEEKFKEYKLWKENGSLHPEFIHSTEEAYS